MNYYSNTKKKSFKIKHKKFILLIITLSIIFNSLLYLFNNKIAPVILRFAEDKLKNEATTIIYEEALDIYSKDFNYKDVMSIEKDDEGNITLLRSDTVKLNYLSSKLILQINEKIKNLEELKIKVPFGYGLNNLILKNMGPKININLDQIGNITSEYESVFQDAGINQTIHRIYLHVNMKLRVAMPFNSEDVEILCKIPVSETIIVGKIPQTAIDLNR